MRLQPVIKMVWPSVDGSWCLLEHFNGTCCMSKYGNFWLQNTVVTSILYISPVLYLRLLGEFEVALLQKRQKKTVVMFLSPKDISVKTKAELNYSECPTSAPCWPGDLLIICALTSSDQRNVNMSSVRNR